MSGQIGLALSGGGFRATLFHVGVIRFLREADMLKSVSHVASVSGGSIFAAHMVLNWDRYNGTDEDFREAVEELIRFVQRDVRNRIVRRIPFQWPLRILQQSIMGRTNRSYTCNGLLEREYKNHLFGDKCCHELPDAPELHILATNLSDGNLASFCREGLYMQRRGKDDELDFVPAHLAPISLAVGASSAFPGFFPPVVFSASEIGARAGEFINLSFTDGGVYDNLGVRAFEWIQKTREQKNTKVRKSDFKNIELAISTFRHIEDDGSPLGWLKNRFSLDLRELIDRSGQGKNDQVQRLLCKEISELLLRHRLVDEPVFRDLETSDEKIIRMIEQAKKGIKLDRHGWLNRQLLATAFRKADPQIRLSTFSADFDHVLVSDCGQSFNVQSDANLSFLAQSVRASDIMWDRVWQLEKENCSKAGRYVFFPITEIVDESRDPDARPEVIQSSIQNIRCDLDRFSDLEVGALIEHGYTVARANCRDRKLLPANESFDGPPWNPFKNNRDSGNSSESMGGEVTKEARELRKSAARRVWSTLLDYRDWPTYVFVPLLILFLIVLPWRAWSFYHDSQTLATIVTAIEKGDPDIKRVLDVVVNDPASSWQPGELISVDDVSTFDHEDLDFLSRSRIEDRRSLSNDSSATNPAVYLSERITIRKSSDYQGDERLVVSYPLPDGIELRAGPEERNPIIRKTKKSTTILGATRTIFEIEYNIAGVTNGGTFDIVVEGLLRHGKVPRTEFGQNRSIFRTHLPIEVVSVWILFSEDRPYKNYHLMVYPMDQEKSPRIVESRFAVDHPYGSLIGWSIVNPELGARYDCRWTIDE